MKAMRLGLRVVRAGILITGTLEDDPINCHVVAKLAEETDNRPTGAVVPTPTLPVLVIRARSLPPVTKPKTSEPVP